MANSYDNRETCGILTPSSCIPYTGQINDSIKDSLPCRPNINDIIKNIQDYIDSIKNSIGDNTTLNKQCFTFNPNTATQKEINQELINKVCELKDAVTTLQEPIDPETIEIAINLLCLTTEDCEIPEKYTLSVILTKLINAYCNLLTRVNNIENILNI